MTMPLLHVTDTERQHGVVRGHRQCSNKATNTHHVSVVVSRLPLQTRTSDMILVVNCRHDKHTDPPCYEVRDAPKHEVVRAPVRFVERVGHLCGEESKVNVVLWIVWYFWRSTKKK